MKKNVALASAALRVSTSFWVYWYGPSSKARARTPGLAHLVITVPSEWSRLMRSIGDGIEAADAQSAQLIAAIIYLAIILSAARGLLLGLL